MSNEVRKIWVNLMKNPEWRKIARNTLKSDKGQTDKIEKKIKRILK